MKTAAQAAANWAASAPRAGTAWTDGVQGYQGDWAGATVAQEAVMLQNLQAAIARGDWRNGVQKKGTSGWKSDTLASTANYQNGFSKGAANQQQAIGKIMNALGGIVPSLPARGTYEQNKLRATALMDGLHSLRGQLGA